MSSIVLSWINTYL